LEIFTIWCCRNVERISWNYRGRNKYYIEARRRKVSNIQQKEGKLNEFATYCVGNAF
jgi:hypothetical protein